MSVIASVRKMRAAGIPTDAAYTILIAAAGVREKTLSIADIPAVVQEIQEGGASKPVAEAFGDFFRDILSYYAQK